jgi:hypothetical protein
MVRLGHFEPFVVNFILTSLSEHKVQNEPFSLHRKDSVQKERAARNNYKNWQHLYDEYKTVGTF